MQSRAPIRIPPETKAQGRKTASLRAFFAFLGEGNARSRGADFARGLHVCKGPCKGLAYSRTRAQAAVWVGWHACGRPIMGRRQTFLDAISSSEVRNRIARRQIVADDYPSA
jgi:hypothetical protein